MAFILENSVKQIDFKYFYCKSYKKLIIIKSGLYQYHQKNGNSGNSKSSFYRQRKAMQEIWQREKDEQMEQAEIVRMESIPKNPIKPWPTFGLPRCW